MKIRNKNLCTHKITSWWRSRARCEGYKEKEAAMQGTRLANSPRLVRIPLEATKNAQQAASSQHAFVLRRISHQ